MMLLCRPNERSVTFWIADSVQSQVVHTKVKHTCNQEATEQGIEQLMVQN